MTDEIREKLLKLVDRDTDKLIIDMKNDPKNQNYANSLFTSLRESLSQYGTNAWWLLNDNKDTEIIYTYYQMYHGINEIPKTKMFAKYMENILGRARDRSVTGLIANGLHKVGGEYRTIIINKTKEYLKAHNYEYETFSDIDKSMQQVLENKIIEQYAKELKINKFNKEKLD